MKKDSSQEELHLGKLQRKLLNATARGLQRSIIRTVACPVCDAKANSRCFCDIRTPESQPRFRGAYHFERRIKAAQILMGGDDVANPAMKPSQKPAAKTTARFLKPGNDWAPSQAAIDDFYNSWEWKRLRFGALKIYGRRCLCCGASASDDVRIVVDHIQPIRKYWSKRLDPKNLQPLCDDCNMGKGTRDTSDFR